MMCKMYFIREFAGLKQWMWLLAGLLLLTRCEKDPAPGIYSICDGKWETSDLLIHGAVTDIDGNEYDAVQIGEQTWMAQNLRTCRYADGTSVYHIEGMGVYYPQGSDSLGLHYNWVTAMRGANSSDANPSFVQGLCPDGWHLPSDAEWTQLIEYVSSQSTYWCGGDNSSIGKALASSVGWTENGNGCAVGYHAEFNNATGFSAPPAGFSVPGYNFNHNNEVECASFWSSTEYDENHAWGRELYPAESGVYHKAVDKTQGRSVRCVKD